MALPFLIERKSQLNGAKWVKQGPTKPNESMGQNGSKPAQTGSKGAKRYQMGSNRANRAQTEQNGDKRVQLGQNLFKDHPRDSYFPCNGHRPMDSYHTRNVYHISNGDHQKGW